MCYDLLHIPHHSLGRQRMDHMAVPDAVLLAASIATLMPSPAAAGNFTAGKPGACTDQAAVQARPATKAGR